PAARPSSHDWRSPGHGHCWRSPRRVTHHPGVERSDHRRARGRGCHKQPTGRHRARPGRGCRRARLVKWREDTSHGTRARLHVLRVADPPAPPVLALHGLGVAGNIWQSFARRLLPHLAVVAPDLRGHGQSDAPPSGYLPTDYANDLIELIQDKDWLEAPVPVVGHSLGALVALALADLRPDLVRWLVLLDPPIDPDLRNPEIPSVYRLRHAAPGELEAYLLSRNPGGGQLLAQSLANLFRAASDAAFEALLNRDDAAGRRAASVVEAEAFAQASRVRQP